MSVRYSRLSTEPDDMESGLGLSRTGSTFDYSSVFTFDSGKFSSKNYKSAFSYSTDTKIQLENDDFVDTGNRTFLDKACYVILNAIIYIMFVATFPISVWFAIKMVPNFERVVVFRWGQLYQTKGPGMVFVMPFVDRCHKVDIRMKAFTVPPQKVITGDRAIIEVGADVYYRVSCPERSITNVQNLDRSMRVLLQTSLLNMLVSLPLARIETQRNAIAQEVMDKCNKSSDDWGIEVCRLDISQIKVLQKPPVNQPKPSIVMPPGLAAFGGGAGGGAGGAMLGAAAQSLASGSVPEAFQQLASAFLAQQGLSLPEESQQPPSRIHSQPPPPVLPTPPDTLMGGGGTSSFPHSTATTSLGGILGLGVGGGGGDGGSSISSPSMPAVGVAFPEQSVGEIMGLARGAVSEALVRKVGAVYQFQLHGEGGGLYYVDLKNGGGSVGEGVYPGGGEADVSLMLSVQDLLQMLSGGLKPFQAYMSGRLRVSGDLATALKLEALVDKVVSMSKAR